MEHLIKLIDNGAERYELDFDDNILGRMYDNDADAIVVKFPEFEAQNNNSCTMIVTAGGEVVDHIQVNNNEPVLIKSNLTEYNKIEIGFSFFNETGYIKNSEYSGFKFLKAQKPDDFVPVPPQQSGNIDHIISFGFTDAGLDANTLWFKNLSGEKVKEFDLSPFTQEQADLSEADATKETYVKGKTTKNLLNEGADGSSPYATEEYVRLNGGKIDSISVNGEQQEIDENKNINLQISKSAIGLSNVDNTSDLDKPVSTATQTLVNSVDTKAQSALDLAREKQNAIGLEDYQAVVNDLNTASIDKYRVGQSIYVKTKYVPDLWVYGVVTNSVPYVYTDDASIVNALNQDGYFQSGHYIIAPLETKEIDLDNYVTIEQFQSSIDSINQQIEELSDKPVVEWEVL